MKMTTLQLGEPLARGSRSVVHAWGTDAVAKVPLPTMPEGWIRAEAQFAAAVHACGAPVPAVLGVEVIDGQEVSLYERIHGPSMWEELVEQPTRVRELAQIGRAHV